MRKQQHRRQDQGAERVDVPERVEADAAELRGGIVSEPVGDEGMRSLVESDGEHEGEHPHRQVIKGYIHQLIRSGSARALRKAGRIGPQPFTIYRYMAFISEIARCR